MPTVNSTVSTEITTSTPSTQNSIKSEEQIEKLKIGEKYLTHEVLKSFGFDIKSDFFKEDQVILENELPSFQIRGISTGSVIIELKKYLDPYLAHSYPGIEKEPEYILSDNTIKDEKLQFRTNILTAKTGQKFELLPYGNPASRGYYLVLSEPLPVIKRPFYKGFYLHIHFNTSAASMEYKEVQKFVESLEIY